METNPALEQAIEHNLDDTASRSVYADWLQSKGDPRGELIALQLAGNEKAAKELLAKHADQFLGKLAAHQQTYDGEAQPAFTWKHGFIHAARLSHNHYATKLDGQLADVLRDLLAHPSGRFLAELTLVFNNDPNEDNLQSLIDVLAERPRPTLRLLHLGDFRYAGAARNEDAGEDTEISWYSVGNLASLWPNTPNLTKLIIQTGSAESALAGGTTLGTLALPALEHFEYRTGGLEQANAQAIAQLAAPRLRHLDVWFGQENYGGTATIDDAAAILARTDLPALRHLGLMNAEFTDDLVPHIADSPLMRQLAELDLSLGCLTDDGAAALAEVLGPTGLQRLDVSYSYLTGGGIASLSKAARRVVADGQRTADGDHYAAVGE